MINVPFVDKYFIQYNGYTKYAPLCPVTKEFPLVAMYDISYAFVIGLIVGVNKVSKNFDSVYGCAPPGIKSFRGHCT